MGLGSGNEKANMGNTKKTTQFKRKFRILLGNFLKWVTRPRGPAENVAQFLADHDGPKGSNKSMEVMRLFVRSSSKARGNPNFEGTNINEANKNDGARSMYNLTSFFQLQSSCNECFDLVKMCRFIWSLVLWICGWV